MARFVFVFAICYFLLLSGGWAKEKAPQAIDQLYLYLEQEVFNAARCKYHLKGLICAIATEKLDLYAEQDGPDGFVLNIHEQPEENLPVRHSIIKVSFTQRDGIVLVDTTDFYNSYPEVRRGKEIQLVVRQWLKNIQKVFNPNYGFMPFK